MSNNRFIGTKYEGIAEKYLANQGLKLIQRNFYCRLGEIDLIMRDKNTTVFVEVKYRNSIYAGDAQEAVTKYKQIQISKTARYYIMQKHLSVDSPYRFDVVAINHSKVQWIKDAFEFVLY